MVRRGHRDQLSFEDFFLPFGGKLAGENRRIKLAELIPWDDLEDDYAGPVQQRVWCSSKALPHGAGSLDHQGPYGAHG